LLKPRAMDPVQREVLLRGQLDSLQRSYDLLLLEQARQPVDFFAIAVSIKLYSPDT